jgi:RHS repeat-associated protein
MRKFFSFQLAIFIYSLLGYLLLFGIQKAYAQQSNPGSVGTSATNIGWFIPSGTNGGLVNTINDYSGNNFNTVPIPNNSLSFNGTTGYVSCPGNISATNTFTMELWVMPSSTITLNTPTNPFSGTQGSSTSQRYAIYPTYGDTPWGAGHVGAGISVGTNGVSVYENGSGYFACALTYTGTISSSAWTHIAVTYNAKIPKIYINGAVVATGTVASQKTVHPSTNIGGTSGGTNFFSGKIDHVRIWDTDRGSQINTFYNYEISGQVPSSGIRLNYTFNEGGAATSTTDFSGYNYNGTLQGGVTWANQTSPADCQSTITTNFMYGYPSAIMNGYDTRFELPDNATINSGGPYTARTMIVSFNPTNLTPIRQVIYEEGNDQKGLNIYIYNSTLFMNAWNLTNEDPNGPWGPKYISTPITQSNIYIASFVYDSDHNVIQGYLNGASFGSISGVGKLFSHLPGVIGCNKSGTRYHDGSITGTNYFGEYFTGYINELALYNTALNSMDRNVVENYMQSRYRNTISNDHYANETNANSWITGIGNDGTSVRSTTSPDNLLTITNSNLGNSSFAFIGSNGASVSTYLFGYLTSSDNAPKNVERISRHYQLSLTGAVPTLDFKVSQSLSLFTSISSNPYQIPVLILNQTPTGTVNFKQNSRIIALQADNTSGIYYANGVPVTNNDYVSIGILNIDEFAASYGHTVSVIGKADIGFEKKNAQPNGILIDNPRSLDIADYFLLGDNNVAITSTPFGSGTAPSGFTRTDIIWKVNEYGETGNVDITIDPTLFTLPPNNDTYVVLVDNDGDFGNGGTQVYGMVKAANKYKAFDLNINNSNYIAIGVIKLSTPNPKDISTKAFQESQGDLTNLAFKNFTVNPNPNVTFATPCPETVTKATMNINFNTGSTYIYGPSSSNGNFSATVNVEIRGYSDYTSTTTVFAVTQQIIINSDQPEKLYYYDLTPTYSSVKIYRVKVLSFTPPANTLIKNALVINASIEEQRKVTVELTTTSPVLNQNYSGTKTYTFSWDTDQCNAPSYQFQLLRLYNLDNISTPGQVITTGEDQVTAEVDWTKALTLETTNKSISLTLAEGTGYYAWRVRPIGNYYDGGSADSRNWGNWTTDNFAIPSPVALTCSTATCLDPTYNKYLFYYKQFDRCINFVYNRSFTEDTKMHEGITYANGLMQVKQTQAKVPSNDQDATHNGVVIGSQTVYDFSGRAVLQSLSAPILDQNPELGFRQQFLQATANFLYRDKNFDDEGTYLTPDRVQAGKVNEYYSDLNGDGRVANADNYPYSRTLYSSDGSGRVKEQSGPGLVHKLSGDQNGVHRTVRVQYGAVSDEELIRIFGDEAPDKNSVYKTATTDQNNITSISYTNKEGKVIATCLSSSASNTNLSPLDETATGFQVIYKVDKNVPYGDGGLLATQPIVMTESGTLTVSYNFTAASFVSDCGSSICATCAYTLTIKVKDLENPSNPSTNFSTTVTIPGDVKVGSSCSNSAPVIDLDPNTAGNDLTLTLPAGKYSVEKLIQLDQTGATAYATAALNQADADMQTLLAGVYNPLNDNTLTDAAKLTQSLAALNTLVANQSIPTSFPYVADVYNEDGSLSFAGGSGTFNTNPGLLNGQKVRITTSCCTVDLTVVTPEFDPCSNPGNLGNYMVEQFLLKADPTGTKTFDQFCVGTNIYTKPQFAQLIANMLAEPNNLYTCQALWTCWQGIIQSYGGFSDVDINATIKTSSTDPDAADINDQPSWAQNATSFGSTYQIDIIDQFLICAGKHYKGFTTDVNLLNQKPYFYFNYTGGTNTPCEDMFCNTPNVDATQMPDVNAPGYIAPCSSPMCTASYPAATDLTYTYHTLIVNGVAITGEDNYRALYECVHAQPLGGTAPTQAELEATVNTQKSQLESQAKQTCEDRYPEFLDALLAIYPSNGSGGYTSSSGTLTYEDICCTAQSMVDDCKSLCSLTVQTVNCSGTPKIVGLGTATELANIRAIIGGSFDVQEKTSTSCPSGYRDVVPSSGLTTPVQCLDHNPAKVWDKAVTGDNVWQMIKTTDGNLIGLGGFGNLYTISKLNAQGQVQWTRTDTIGAFIFPISGGGCLNLGNAAKIGKFNSDGTLAWRNTYSATAGYSIMVEVTDGYVLGGSHRIGSGGDSEIEVIKVDKNGVLIWRKNYSLINYRYHELLNIIKTNDGNFLLVGDASNDSSSDGYVLKIKSDGTLLWQKTIGGNSYEYFDKAYLCNDGDYVLSGNSSSSDIPGYPNPTNVGYDYIVKLSPDGLTIRWQKLLSVNWRQSLVLTSDNKIIVGSSGVNPQGTNSGLDIYLGILNYEGDFVQEKYFGGSSGEWYNSMQSTSDGGYIVYGVTNSSDVPGDLASSYYSNNSDFKAYFLKLDHNLNMQWQRCYLGVDDLIPNTGTHAIEELPNGTFVGVITSRGTNGSGSDRTDPNSGSNNMWFIAVRNGSNNTCNPREVCMKWIDPTDVVYPENPPVPPLDPNKDKHTVTTTIETIDASRAKCKADNEARLLAEYKYKCLNSQITDNLTVTQTLGYYHYTLYYYDRPGNLIRTVPPKGFVPVDLTDPNAKLRLVPTAHKYITKYKYNSLGQLVQQYSPDGNTTNFIYNRVGQLRFSQNAKQLNNKPDGVTPVPLASYTKYDYLGRAIEVGQVDLQGAAFNTLNSTAYLETVPFGPTSWPTPNSSGIPATSEQTYTVYSSEAANVDYLGQGQTFLQNRVSYMYNFSKAGERSVTYFSYDPHGNVNWLVQEVPGFSKTRIGYEYDLISNKVTKVKYNEELPDQFFHKYCYDADNRITAAFTSRDGKLWDKDGAYQYFKHGPLKRTELGEDAIQGLDYTYTLQGWLKAVNTPTLDVNVDGDGNSTSSFLSDEYGFVLGYYNGDFTRTGSIFNSASLYYGLSNNKDLYNGNISYWTSNIKKENIGLTANTFTYDYLNRLSTTQYNTYNSGYTPKTDYYTHYTYDPNGNLVTLLRNAAGSTVMDDLHYTLDNSDPNNPNNRLAQIVDQATTNAFDDIEGTLNYGYDEIGNLTQDPDGYTISWTLQGKISEIKLTNPGTKSEVKYTYDAAGQRIKKEVNTVPYNGTTYQKLPENVRTYYYVRDASGNIMAIYERVNTPVAGQANYYTATYTLKELPMYGSSRLGNFTPSGAYGVVVASKVFYKDDVDKIDFSTDVFTRVSEYMNWEVTTQQTDVRNDKNSTPQNLNVTNLSKLTYSSGSDNISATSQLSFLGSGVSENVSIAEDANGVVQFYVVTPTKYWGSSNVCLVYDAQGMLMPGLLSIFSDAKSQAVILKKPGNNNQYFLFTVYSGMIRYSVIDMNAIGNGTAGSPRGDVISVNTVLDAGFRSGFGTKMVALEDQANGTAVLYTTLHYSNGTMDIIGYTITETTKTPRTMWTATNWNTGVGQSEFAIAPNGKKLLVYNHLKNTGWFDHQTSEVYSFDLGYDNEIVNNPITNPPVRYDVPYGTLGGQSADYSKDNRYIYYTRELLVNADGTTGSDKVMYRYDIRENQNVREAVNRYGDIRRGRDGRLYMANKKDTKFPAFVTDAYNNYSNVTTKDVVLTTTPTGAISSQNHKLIGDGTVTSSGLLARLVGWKQYELNDHLGNVTVVVSDRRDAVLTTGVTNSANVLTYNNYYAFGMKMPGRTFNAMTGEDNGSGYRYGYNGKEQDWSAKNTDGVIYDYGFRIYDARIARFLSVDPLSPKYPMLTPYQFASNRPIDGIDLDGLEYVTFHIIKRTGYGTTIKVIPYSSNRQEFGPQGPGASYEVIQQNLDGKEYYRYSLFIKRTAPATLLGFKLGNADYGLYYGPTTLKKYWTDGNKFDYTASPIDEVDRGAFIHDQDYDLIGAEGENALSDDWGTIEADLKAVNTWKKVMNLYDAHGIDPHNGQPVTEAENDAASGGVLVFNYFINNKLTDISNMMSKWLDQTGQLDSYKFDKKNPMQYMHQLYEIWRSMYMIKKGDSWIRNEKMWTYKINSDGKKVYSPVALPTNKK